VWYCLHFTKIDSVVTMKKLRWTNCQYKENVNGRTPPGAVLTNDMYTSVINDSAATIFGSSRILLGTGPLQCVGSGITTGMLRYIS
jgi:hypothetical protein